MNILHYKKPEKKSAAILKRPYKWHLLTNAWVEVVSYLCTPMSWSDFIADVGSCIELILTPTLHIYN